MLSEDGAEIGIALPCRSREFIFARDPCKVSKKGVVEVAESGT